jgi:nucleoside-diphosphate-sugar epimerase
MHVLVTGAAGKVGQAFLARFHAEAAGNFATRRAGVIDQSSCQSSCSKLIDQAFDHRRAAK